jgi:membrane protein implicated in regulation of membrane protease activity
MQRRFWRDNGLTLALLALFTFSIGGHALSGWGVNNQDRLEHGHAVIGLMAYLASGEFMSSVFENWESEFLQMAVFVVLTAYLFQRGSPESDDPDVSPAARKAATTRDMKAARRKIHGGELAVWLYSKSLGLVLAALFAASFVLHLIGSTRHAADEALDHGQAAPTILQHLHSAGFWFESFQNWQSEFLSLVAMVVLSIWLRQRGSPESKPVDAPHSQTGTD